MKTLLVLAEHPDFAEAIRAGINPEHYRVIARTDLAEAEPLLEHGLAEACIVDVELTGVQGIWFLEKLHRKAPRCPVILYAGTKQSEWEEEAYLQGVTHVLTKPVRGRMLTALLDRLWLPPAAIRPTQPAFPSLPPETVKSAEMGTTPAATQTLGVLRDFSAILTHSLNAEGMLKQFLLLLREILSINRAAIFLRQPLAGFGNAPVVAESRRLRAACAIGLSPGLLQHFELSFEAGIGGHIFRLGRILRRFGEQARMDVETQKEFELLGAQVAVPILDRETVLGVAVFDGRITGEPLVNSELELIFHLLEQLGLAVKNIWLHDQLACNHQMMADILRELSSACVVVSRDLAVLHANKSARKYFCRAERRGGDLEFSDLPQILGAKVYQVLKTGAAISSFKYEPEDSPGTVYNINIVPFQRPQAGSPASALLMAEDLTQSEQLQRLEIEAANLRLVKTMADRLMHEIGNALVPLSTHQQLLAARWKDPEFRTTLSEALAGGVDRVNRLINQMRFLARDTLFSQESSPLAELLEEAYQEAGKHLPAKAAPLKYDPPSKPITLPGDRAALKHALAEVMLNALQANLADAKIGILVRTESGGNGLQVLQLEVQDNGGGFTPEAAKKAFVPFFTTRTVGLGLGLTVARKIIETHRGRLEIVAPKSGQNSVVRISLPLEAALTLQT
jgi:signal transduction histidine kinase/DNA-binding NarL/FixJ family response regulator